MDFFSSILFGFFFSFLDFLWKFLDFLFFLFGGVGGWFLWILFKVTKVTIKHYQGYYWTHKIGQNSKINSLFLPGGQKKPWSKLEVGPRSGPYLLVISSNGKTMRIAYIYFLCFQKKKKKNDLLFGDCARLSPVRVRPLPIGHPVIRKGSTFLLLLQIIKFGNRRKQVCCAGCRRRPFPMQLHQ